MTYVDPKIGDAQEPFRTALAGLLAECDGRARIGNAWRSTERQAVLYYNYIHHIGGQATAAKPGTSNHEYGLAADLEGDLPLAHRLAAKYGLHWPVPGEDWHVEKIGVNRHTMPAPWSPGHDPVVPPKPVGYQPPPFPGTVKGHPDRITAWAKLLHDAGGQGFNNSGVWGPGKTAATRRFQKRRGLKVDGIPGPKTWAAAALTAIASQAKKAKA